MKKLILFFDFNNARRRCTLALEFKLADFWVGVFWKARASTGARQFEIWVCLLPCLPLHFSLIRQPPAARDLDAPPPVFVEPGRKPSSRQRRTIVGMRRVLEDQLACAPCRRRLLP